MFRKLFGSTPTQRNTAMVGFAALILLAIVGLSYREWYQYHRANIDAARTREVLDSFDSLFSSLIDADTGQRGFLLTGADRYLEPYDRAVRAIPGELGNLRRLLASRQSDSADLERLTNLVHQKLRELRQAIDLRRTQGAGPALDIVLSDRGKRTLDELRAIYSTIQHRQTSAQHEASLNREAAAQIALLAAVAASLISFSSSLSVWSLLQAPIFRVGRDLGC